MRGALKTFVCVAAVVFSVTSCDQFGMVWDVAPVCFTLRATDATHDLFDPEYEGNIIEQVSVTYDGEEYKVEPQTKDYYAQFNGLTHTWLNDGHGLVFGEFPGDTDYKDMTLTVNWPDGEKDVIVYSRTFKWDWDGSPKVKESTTINGEKGKRLIERSF